MRARTIRCGGIGAAALAVVATLASSAPAEHSVLEQVSIGGNGDGDPRCWLGASEDGTRVFFETDEALPGTGDTDATNDIYERSGDQTDLRSPGTSFADFLDASDDGCVILVRTGEQLDPVEDKRRVRHRTLRCSARARDRSSSRAARPRHNQRPADRRPALGRRQRVRVHARRQPRSSDGRRPHGVDGRLPLDRRRAHARLDRRERARRRRPHPSSPSPTTGRAWCSSRTRRWSPADEGTWDVYAHDAGAAEPDAASRTAPTSRRTSRAPRPTPAAVVFRTVERLPDSDTDDNVRPLQGRTGTGAAQHVSTGPDGGNSELRPAGAARRRVGRRLARRLQLERGARRRGRRRGAARTSGSTTTG